jgi:hypothetical protein
MSALKDAPPIVLKLPTTISFSKTPCRRVLLRAAIFAAILASLDRIWRADGGPGRPSGAIGHEPP